jgi:prepilin-type N-terminal cleavage/methylation domain-containing protein
MIYKHKGFTLLELTVALALLAILAAAAVLIFRPSGSAAQHRRLQNASATLQATMRQAQREAVSTGRRVYMIIPIYSHQHPTRNRFAIVRENYRWSYLPEGVHFSAAPTAPFGYTARGTSTHALTIWLQTEHYQQRLTIAVAGGRAEAFPIEPIP